MLDPTRTDAKETKELRLLIDDLLKKKFTDPSTSPFASPVLLVRKPDGTYRLVIDYKIVELPIPSKKTFQSRLLKIFWQR